MCDIAVCLQGKAFEPPMKFPAELLITLIFE
jgi:hypothetical protein